MQLQSWQCQGAEVSQSSENVVSELDWHRTPILLFVLAVFATSIAQV